jgi:DNA-binding MarR family transcriptional regulator
MATTSTPSGLAAQLRVVLARTGRRLRREADAGLSATLVAALATVERHGPLTPSELAGRERVQRPTATRLIARLEVDGLVTRTADPTDGRSSLIAISDGGRALLHEARTRKDAYLARRLQTLNAEDRATLARAAVLLERLLEEEDRP